MQSELDLELKIVDFVETAISSEKLTILPLNEITPKEKIVPYKSSLTVNLYRICLSKLRFNQNAFHSSIANYF